MLSPGNHVFMFYRYEGRLVFLLIDGNTRAIATGSRLVFERSDIIIEDGTVKALLEDGLGFDGLEFGLEVFGAFGMG